MRCALLGCRGVRWGVGSLTPGKEALLVGQQTGGGGSRHEGGGSGELEEAAHWWQVPFPEGGVKGEGWHILQDGQGSASRAMIVFEAHAVNEKRQWMNQITDLSYPALWLGLPDLTLVDFTQGAEDLRNKTKRICWISSVSKCFDGADTLSLSYLSGEYFHHVFLQTKRWI